MNDFLNDHLLDRRSALRIGGLSVSLAALLAACGGSDVEFGTVGEGVDVAKPVSTDGKYDDAVLLRTAASLHHSAISAIDAAAGVSGINDSVKAAALAYKVQLGNQAAHLGTLTSAAGGVPWTKGNPVFDADVTGKALELTGKSKTAGEDVGRIIQAVLEVAASTHQFLVPLFKAPELRVAVMQIGLTHARTAAAVAALISPENIVSAESVVAAAPPAPEPPTTLAQDIAQPEETEATEPPAPTTPDVEVYQVPTTFGQVGATLVTLGNSESTEDDKRQVVGINTLYLNSFIYNTMS